MALLFDELKIAAKAGELSWLCPTFQEQVAAELIDSKVAQRFPPRRSYVSRFTKVCDMGRRDHSRENFECTLLSREDYSAPSSGLNVLSGILVCCEFW